MKEKSLFDWTSEELEAHLALRKKVKPTPTSKILADYIQFEINSRQMSCSQIQEELENNFDWTPPKHDYELSLIKGFPALWLDGTIWKCGVYDPGINFEWRPFNKDLIDIIGFPNNKAAL